MTKLKSSSTDSLILVSFYDSLQIANITKQWRQFVSGSAKSCYLNHFFTIGDYSWKSNNFIKATALNIWKWWSKAVFAMYSCTETPGCKTFGSMTLDNLPNWYCRKKLGGIGEDEHRLRTDPGLFKFVSDGYSNQFRTPRCRHPIGIVLLVGTIHLSIRQLFLKLYSHARV